MLNKELGQKKKREGEREENCRGDAAMATEAERMEVLSIGWLAGWLSGMWRWWQRGYTPLIAAVVMMVYEVAPGCTPTQ